MPASGPPPDSLVLRVAREIAGTIRPLLGDAAALPRLGAVIKDKGDGHTAHHVDLLAEQVLFQVLDGGGYAGRVYSEESGLTVVGDEPRLLVCDPYCNSSLTFRGIRESAVAVYEYTTDGRFVAGAIADLQVPRVVYADRDRATEVLGLNPAAARSVARCSAQRRVDQAMVVVSLLKRKRRASMPAALVRDAGLLATIDGAIVAARIAVGEVDAFADASVGQPAYEVLAYELVARAGGVVSDHDGAPVPFADIAVRLGAGHVGRQTVVAACCRELHTDILARLNG